MSDWQTSENEIGNVKMTHQPTHVMKESEKEKKSKFERTYDKPAVCSVSKYVMSTSYVAVRLFPRCLRIYSSENYHTSKKLEFRGREFCVHALIT